MKTWSEVGEVQPLVHKILINSIQRSRLSHAYLFQGERGTGKSSLALLLAKTLFCEKKSGIEPCQTCVMCKRIESGNHPDVHWIEPEGQSIRIAQVEALQKEFSYTGMESNRKVYIIKAADTLTVNAANRILKFLEEPQQQTTAIMLTENGQSILPTIRSRCQILDFRPLNPVHFQERLMVEGIPKSNARLLSALTNHLSHAKELHQDETFVQARDLVIQLMKVLAKNPEDAYLFIHQKWLPFFKDKSGQEHGLDLLLLAFRDILYAHISKQDSMVFFQENGENIESFILSFTEEDVISILQYILEAKRAFMQYVQPTLVMERLTLQIQG